MHSSRMGRVQCSGRLSGKLSAQLGVYLGGVFPEVVYTPRPRGRPHWTQRQTPPGPRGRHHLPSDQETDTPPPSGHNDRCLWKHYLSTSTVADGKNLEAQPGIEPRLLA